MKLLSWIIMDPQDCSYQVSSLESQNCSVCWSYNLKSTVLGKKSNVVRLQPNFKIWTNINILKSYASIDQVWIIIPQENCSNHQNGKMVKIRVLTVFDWSKVFLPNTWSNGMKHNLKDSNTTCWPNFMAQNISQEQLIDSWNSVNWWKVNRYTKKSNFDFLIKIKFQKSHFIKTCQNSKT